MRAIKAGLGTIFVQDPTSAKYDGMPLSAINTGLADYVLPPDEIPGQLLQFIKHASVNGARLREVVEEAQEPLQMIFAILRTRTGHDFSHYKKATIHRRLERRMSVNGIDHIAKYAKFLRDNEAEARALLRDILISVTSFFRDPEAFDAMKKQVCELLRKKTQGGDLRVWVAGCATGEEAYSVAMIVSECMDEVDKRFQVQMYATDIDTDGLKQARAAIYPANIAADISPERLRHFFVKQKDSYQVNKELREKVVFAPQDFIKDPPFSRMDIICCRNLLIYLENEVQKRLLPLLHYALRPGGILFLGPSETIGDASDLFGMLDRKWKIYQRREVAVPPERLRFPAAFAPALREPAGEMVADLTGRVPALTEKIFLDSYAPTFAIIDGKYRLVYVRGRTGKYLEIASGQPSWTIMEMAREGLRNELTTAIYQVALEKKAVVREGVKVKYNGGFQSINLTVAPLTEHRLPPGLMMVVFQDTGPTTGEGQAEPAAARHRRTARVEDELLLTREKLQSTIEEMEATNEELKSANEELQSNNEELQSTNEELDTSREELQSLNEEMMTVNAELSAKTEMLTKANDDLKNYLNRTDIAIVFLDDELKIRSFTPATTDVFNIREIDIGRSLEEITSRLAYDGVVDDARKVLRTLEPKEVDVQLKDGHWYTMRTLPYLTVQNAVGGLVISFLDINKQRQAIDELARVNKKLKEALEKRLELEKALKEEHHDLNRAQVVACTGSWRLDTQNNRLVWSDETYRIFGIPKGTPVTYEKFLSMAHPEDREYVDRKWKAALKGEQYDIEHRIVVGRKVKWVREKAELELDAKGVLKGGFGTVQDITDRKQAQQKLLEYEKLAYLGKVAGNIAHEIRNPIAAIDTSVFYLEKALKGTDDKTRAHFERIRTAVQRTATIINKLLDNARMKEPSLSELDLVTFIKDIIRAVPKTIEVVLDIPGDNSIINADTEQLRIAFNNIVRNAEEAMQGTGRLTIKVQQNSGQAEISVSDTGPGIPKENIEHLFQPLFTTKPGGVGFGLAMAKSIIERHNGSITAESKPGEGATFIIRLPLAEKTHKKTT